MFSRISKYKLLIVLGLLCEALYLTFLIGQDSEKSIALYIIVYASAFVVSLFAYFIVHKSDDEDSSSGQPFGFSKSLVVIFIFGLVFRATMIPTVPSTSDDVYRYIWEGKLVYHGENPFELAPDNPKLKHLHSEKYPELVTYPDMTTIYPAAAQYTFMLGYIISGENDTGLKLIYLLAELITFVFLIKILRLRKLNPNFLILYAWLPLPIMEYFINSHIDVVGICFFLIFLYYILQDKYVFAALPFALSVLVKLYPLMILPLLIKKLRLNNFIKFSALFSLILFSAIVLFLPEERSVNSSLFTYLSTWSFNGSAYTIFYSIFQDSSTARSIILVLFMVAAGNIAVRYDDFLKAVYGVWICFIMFAATLFPWYLGWIAAVNPMFGLASVTSLLFTVNVTNFTPLGEVWQEYWWAYLIQYIPFYLFLGNEILVLIRTNRNQ